MHCILVCWGDLFACSGGLLIRMYSMYKMGGKKAYLCLWVTEVSMSGRAILDLKSSISQKLIPQAATVDKWVPADGENMHSGYDHTAAKYGCHSKLKFTHSSITKEDDHHTNTKKA